MYGDKVNLAVLNGNANLLGDNYIGIDGSIEEIEFSDAAGRRRKAPMRSKNPKKRGGKLRNFAQGLGIDPKASQERRDLRRKKQTDQNQIDRQNMVLQQQALDVAARQPDPASSLPPQMQTRPMESTISPSGWKAMPKWQKGLIIGVGVAALGFGVYMVVKSQTKK